MREETTEFTFGLSIGPQRCGTDYLRQYFKQRDDVCLPADAQEIFYFDRHFQRGSEFYFSHFHPRDTNHMLLELTTTAFDHADAPARVYSLMGENVRLICPLRHPVDRSLAVYQDYLKYGLVHGPIDQVAETMPQILFASRYSDHLKRWFEAFDPSQFTFLFYEQAQQDRSAFLSTACQGLGLDFHDISGLAPEGRFKNPVISGLKSIGKMFSPAPKDVTQNKQIRDWLTERLDDEHEKLEALLGMEISWWGKS